MRKLLTYSLLLLLSVSFVSCGADGQFDEALFREFAEEFQQEILPTKDEFRRMAEAKIAEMPAEDQAQARTDLAEALAKWPSDAEIDKMVDEAVAKMPSRAEIDQALNQLGEEVPGGKTLRNLIENAIEDDMPSGEVVNKTVRETMNELKRQIDSLERATRN